MGRILVFMVCLLVTVSCSKSSKTLVSVINYDEDTINRAAEELSFQMTVQTDSGRYLSYDVLDSIILFVNDEYWRTVPSLSSPLSTDNIVLEDSIYTSSDRVEYSVLVDAGEVTRYSTGGEFADLLNDELRLYPGSYLFEIQTIYIHNSDSSVVKIDVDYVTSFEVPLNARSVYSGNYQIQL